MSIIKIKRGLKVNLPALEIGELAFCTDTKELFIGSNDGNILMPKGLNGLNDVDVNTIVPVDGNVLKYEGGMWKPGVGGSGLTLSSYLAGEEIKLLSPLDVNQLELIEKTKTTIKINWDKSKSTNIKEYVVYVDSVLNGVTTNTNFTISGLTAASNYVITVKAKNIEDQESNGVSLNAKTQGNFVFTLPGANLNYIEIPEIEFQSIDISCYVTPKVSSWGNYIIVTTTAATTYAVLSQYNGASYRIDNFGDIYVDGILQTSTSNAIIPSNVNTVVRIDVPDNYKSYSVNIKDKLYVFADKNKVSSMSGKIYRITIYSKGDRRNRNIIADYDLTYQVANGLVSDSLGNYPPIKLFGGSFIAN